LPNRVVIFLRSGPNEQHLSLVDVKDNIAERHEADAAIPTHSTAVSLSRFPQRDGA
jgi:hypothetical protein